jgi:hypothetical protein
MAFFIVTAAKTGILSGNTYVGGRIVKCFILKYNRRNFGNKKKKADKCRLIECKI